MEISEYTEQILQVYDDMLKRLRVHGRQILKLKPEDRLQYVEQLQRFQNVWDKCDAKARIFLASTLNEVMTENGGTTASGNVS
jgi:hypothetical protein